MEPGVACRVDFLLPRAHDAVNAAYIPFLSYVEYCMMACAQVCVPLGAVSHKGLGKHLQRDVDFSSRGVPCLGSPK